MLKCTILGCGGSDGVPQIGCNCSICLSSNPYNKRSRVSILIESETTTILVDTSPDFRQQALTNNIIKLDAILITHAHADHISGIDDIKILAIQAGKAIPIHTDQETYNILINRYDYLFKQLSPLYPARLDAKIINHYDKFIIGDIEILNFLQHHDYIHSLGFRFGDLVYSTDINAIPESSYQYLNGVKHWILDCQKYHWVPSHAYIEAILDWRAQFKPQNIYLTHMSHTIDYDEIKRIMPSNVIPAHDGMQIIF